MKLEYHIVDVFTRNPLEGNALAVFLNGQGLSDSMMQKIAKELNLSETTFVLPSSLQGCDCRVRIFTPTYELGFAGHPTLGTAYVVHRESPAHRATSRLVLEENAGPVQVRIDSGEHPLFWLDSPPTSNVRVYERARCAQSLGLLEDDLLPNVPCRMLTAGTPIIFVALRDSETVDRAVLDPARFAELHADAGSPVLMFIFTPVPEGAYSRMFAPDLGIAEDPATGGAAGPLATFMMQQALAPSAAGTRFTSEQGTKIGRRSMLHIRVNGAAGSEGIQVGGHVVPIARATMTLEI